MTSLRSKHARISKYTGAINDLVENDGRGNIDGVQFELSHESLDPGKWATIDIFINFMYLPNELDDDCLYNKQQIWFPWFGSFDPTKVAARFSKLTDGKLKALLKSLSPSVEDLTFFERPAEHLLQLYTPQYFMESGDKLVVSRTFDLNSGHKYLHEHDTILKQVFVTIIKADGCIAEVGTPYIVAGNYSVLGTTRDSADPFGSILFRIVKFHNLRQPGQLKTIKSSSSEISSVSAIAYKLYKLTEAAFYDSDDTKKYTEDDIEDAEELLEVVNEAVLMGFLWAKNEADTNLRPFADKVEWRRRRSREGGLKGTNTRREVARQMWMNQVEVMAEEIRKKEPGLSQDKLADEIIFRGLPNDKLPGHARIKQFISELEKSGRLDKRVQKLKSGDSR